MCFTASVSEPCWVVPGTPSRKAICGRRRATTPRRSACRPTCGRRRRCPCLHGGCCIQGWRCGCGWGGLAQALLTGGPGCSRCGDSSRRPAAAGLRSAAGRSGLGARPGGLAGNPARLQVPAVRPALGAGQFNDCGQLRSPGCAYGSSTRLRRSGLSGADVTWRAPAKPRGGCDWCPFRKENRPGPRCGGGRACCY